MKDAQKVTVCDYSDLSVSKTANTAFTRTYSYDIAKKADKTRIDGDSGVVNYTVTVSDKSYADTAFVVSGTITVHNPNTTQATVKTITDKIGATTCTVTLPANLVVAAGGDITATYTCVLSGVDASTVGQNTASATWDTTGLPGSSGQANGSATYDFTKATITDVNKTVNVVDDKTNPGSSVALGTHTWGNPGPSEDFSYQLTLAGTAGTCKDYTNTASITQTKQSAQSTVTVCDYKNLTVTKTADASFARDFDWTITKDVDHTSAQVNEGQNAPFAYTVTATKSAPKDSGFTVKGSIKVSNPNATAVALTGLTDALPGGDCTITGSTTQTVPANGSVTLTYTCTLPDATATTSDVNTATATWTLPGTTGSATGQAGFDFSKVSPALTDDTASVSDTSPEFSALPDAKTINKTTTFTYTRQLGSQVPAGTCQPFPNDAKVTATDSKAVDEASQSVTVCVNPNVVVKKTVTSTTENPDGTWTVVYDLKVTNPSSTVDTTYDLSDTLQFGGAITINSATWAGAGTGDFAGAVTKVFATGKALAHSATDTYTVTVNATVGQNAWTNHTTECAENGSAPGGFLNTAKVTSGGKTSTDWACDTPGSLTIKKSVDGSVTQNADGTFTVTYDVTVTNASDKAQWYSLTDTPAFSSGVAIQASSATDRNGDPIPGYNGTLATGVQISAAQGGQAKVDTYTVSYTVKVTGSLVDSATCQGSGTGLFNSATLSTGTITLDDSACVNIPTGKITLKKVVLNKNGGTAKNTDWTLAASGPTAGISGHTGDASVTAVVAATGSYTLSESTKDGYELQSLVCTNGDANIAVGQGGTIALPAGSDVVCTFTNVDLPAHLTLVKEVDETDAGGNVTPDQFTLWAEGPAPSTAVAVTGNGDPNSVGGVKAVAISAGTYTIGEDQKAGFDLGKAWSCTATNGTVQVGATDPATMEATITVSNGADVTCTIVNHAIAPKLTLKKVVDNSSYAGAGTPADWTLSASGDGGSFSGPTGVSSSVKVGTYDLSEAATGPSWHTAGYTLSTLVCTEGEKTFETSVDNPQIDLVEGDDVTCTFTNVPTPAKWTLSKSSLDVNNGNTQGDAMPGDQIDYTITITHTGSWPAAGFTLPQIDDLGPLLVNAKLKGGFTSTIGAATLDAQNKLSWAASAFDLSTQPGSITITYSVTVNDKAWHVQLPNYLTPPETVSCVGDCGSTYETPDLELWKTSTVTKGIDPTDQIKVLPGGEVTYTLNAHNYTGVDLLAGQTETDDLSKVLVHGATLVTPLDPALVYNAADKTLTWTLPAIDAGDSASISFAVKVSDQAGPYDLDNTLVPGTIGHCPPFSEEVSLEAVGQDPKCTTHNEVPKIDVGIDKSYLLNEGQTAVDDDPGASSEYTYGLDVTNHSTTGVQNVTVTDPLPSEIKLDTTKGTGGFDNIPSGWHPSYDAATNKVTIAIDAMAVGETGTITLHVVVQPVVVTGPVAEPGTKIPDPVTPPATIDNTACVSVALDTDSTNNCSTVKVPQKTINANIWVQCVADVPYLNYDITGTNVDPTLPVTLTWTANQPGVGGVPADDLPPVPANLVRTLHIGDSGKILWPGGAVTPEGVGIGFPGWRAITEADLNPDGTMKDPSAITFQGLVYDRLHVATDAWRYESTVTIHINPTQTVTVSYPPASAACAVQRPTDLTIKKTASVSTVTPGSSFTYDMVVTNVNLGAASPVTVTDKIPADLKITGITTSTTAFPRWTNCAVTGQDGSGYGGNLTCSLFGPLKLGETAPKITLAATLNSASKATSITNTGVVTWTNTDNPSDTGSAESSVTVGVPQPLAVTGGTLLWQLLPFGMLVILAGTGLLLVNRRRKNGEKAPQV